MNFGGFHSDFFALLLFCFVWVNIEIETILLVDRIISEQRVHAHCYPILLSSFFFVLQRTRKEETLKIRCFSRNTYKCVYTQPK